MIAMSSLPCLGHIDLGYVGAMQDRADIPERRRTPVLMSHPWLGLIPGIALVIWALVRSL
jgi:hypothetical protein